MSLLAMAVLEQVLETGSFGVPPNGHDENILLVRASVSENSGAILAWFQVAAEKNSMIQPDATFQYPGRY